jgi:hypothetical protein
MDAEGAAVAARAPWSDQKGGRHATAVDRNSELCLRGHEQCRSGASLVRDVRPENPIELEGVVQEFKFTSPHSFIILAIKQQDGSIQLWSLEGGAPSALVRDGWSSKTLKPGDELKLTIEPLRSVAPGGSWSVSKTKLKDGQPILVSQ